MGGVLRLVDEGVQEVGFRGVRWLGVRGEAFGGRCWSVLELRVMGRFGEAVDFSEKAYCWILVPKLDLGTSSVSGAIAGASCASAML